MGGRGIEVEYSASILVRPPKRCEFVRTERTIVRAKARHCYEPIRRPTGFLIRYTNSGRNGGAHVGRTTAPKSDASLARVYTFCFDSGAGAYPFTRHHQWFPQRAAIQNRRAAEKYAGRARREKEAEVSGIALQGRTSYSKTMIENFGDHSRQRAYVPCLGSHRHWHYRFRLPGREVRSILTICRAVLAPNRNVQGHMIRVPCHAYSP